MLEKFLLSLQKDNVSIIAVGVLGLCAIVLSSPYDIPTYVPDALMLLCEHLRDPDLIQVCTMNQLLYEYMNIFIFRNRLNNAYQSFVAPIKTYGMSSGHNSPKIN
jgi:hypothetical protein